MHGGSHPNPHLRVPLDQLEGDAEVPGEGMGHGSDQLLLTEGNLFEIESQRLRLMPDDDHPSGVGDRADRQLQGFGNCGAFEHQGGRSDRLDDSVIEFEGV